MSNNRDAWAPYCSLEVLRQRARMLATIRRFFAERDVLEVETPSLGHRTVTEPNLSAFATHFQPPGASPVCRALYLQTSPEFAMKRLLAAGSGCVYQIGKAFRNAELGRLHNPEFTLLEWYRTEFGLTELMDEVDALLHRILDDAMALAASERLPYRLAFLRHAGIDPITATIADFARCAHERGYPEAESLCGLDRSLWLDLLFSHAVQPHLGRGRISFVHDFPKCLPSLARAKQGEPEIVERVEVFLGGMELANGFHELADATEQERRFDDDLARRAERGLPTPEKDSRLLAALRAGLPDCTGIALGIDRLLMLRVGTNDIADVLAFPFERA